MLYQPPLPDGYTQMPQAIAQERIAAARRALAGRMCILAHHYQRDSVFDLADFTGDSLKLSQQAAATTAPIIVFCGVHFMAESADILTLGQRTVILPDLAAGCAMAEMADADEVAEALAYVQSIAEDKVVPVTYVNSSAAIKAATGRAGGACCTSSNARNVFAWALTPAEQGGAGASKVFALPDQHLGRNTAVALGHALDDCVVYDPRREHGGLTPDQIRRARFILWSGYCYVHQKFTVAQIQHVRAAYPGIQVIVHPECPYEVVQAADASGSTEQILHAVSAAPAGGKWAVGTEANMVHRLAQRHPDRLVRTLSDTPPMCANMARTDLPHVLWVLEELAAGRVVNQISVPPDVADDARVALNRMMQIKAVAGVTAQPARPDRSTR